MCIADTTEIKSASSDFDFATWMRSVKMSVLGMKNTTHDGFELQLVRIWDAQYFRQSYTWTTYTTYVGP